MSPAAAAPRKTQLLPHGDVQLANLGQLVARYWAANAWLTLRYTTAAAFEQAAAAYQQAVGSRQEAGSGRPALADEILDLDQQIDSTLYRVKDRLTSKYDKKKAPAYYPVVGIIKYRKAYILDRERTRRAAALRSLVAGLDAEKIADGPYGTAFWQPIADRYNALVPLLADAGGDISQAVATKDTQRAAVTQVLSSVAKVLDGNFPDDDGYKAELRATGFQRETY